MTLFWLSFVDPGRPEGTRFLGVCIVEGDDVVDATRNAHALGINPGGAIRALEVPEKFRPFLPRWVHRLLTREECEAFDREMLEIGRQQGWRRVDN